MQLSGFGGPSGSCESCGSGWGGGPGGSGETGGSCGSSGSCWSGVCAFLLFDLIHKYFQMEILSLMIQKNFMMVS